MFSLKYHNERPCPTISIKKVKHTSCWNHLISPCLFQQLLPLLQRGIFVVLWLERWCVHQGRVYHKTVGLDLILHLHESHQYPLFMGSVSFLLTLWNCSWELDNDYNGDYLTKVPRGFYDAPWNMGWSQDFKVCRDIIFKSCKCLILVLGERLSRNWCGIERPEHGEERGSW